MQSFCFRSRNDQDRWAYFSPSFVIAKPKVKTCSSLSSKSVYSILCFIAGSASSFSFSSLNFSNCSSLKELALVCDNYRRSHFLFLSQKLCVAEHEAACLSSSRFPALNSLIYYSVLSLPVANDFGQQPTSPLQQLPAHTKLWSPH